MRSGPSPLSGGTFNKIAAVISFPLSKVAGWVLLLLPSLAGLLNYSSPEGLLLPHSLGLGHPTLFATFLFSCLFIVQFVFSLFFPPGWGSVCPGGYADLAQHCLWEYHISLSPPGGLRLPKESGSWCLVVQEPSWFLCLTWSGDVMHGLGVWRSQSFASSWCFFLPGISPASLQDFILGNMLSASSL
jgi:hypothetical protein